MLKTFIWIHILLNKTGIVVLDANGDFAEQVARFKDNNKGYRASRLVYIDPTLSSTHFPVINPLDLHKISTETLDKVTQQMYKTLVQSFKELNITLTGAMEGMLYNMLHTLYRKKNSSLLDLVRFVDDEQNADLIELGCQTDNYVIRDYFTNKFVNSLMSVTKHGLANRLNNFLAAQTLQRLITGETTVDLKKAINQKKLIVFNISK